MAKRQADIIAFPIRQAEIIPFHTQYCGCGCGTLLNKKEDPFIISEEKGQWYEDEDHFLKAEDVVKKNGFYQYRFTDYWYTESDFYEELSAYWVNVWAPIA